MRRWARGKERRTVVKRKQKYSIYFFVGVLQNMSSFQLFNVQNVSGFVKKNYVVNVKQNGRLIRCVERLITIIRLNYANKQVIYISQED